MKKFYLFLLYALFTSGAYAATSSIWGATDRGPVQGTFRIPVDIGVSSTPGQVSASELSTYTLGNITLTTTGTTGAATYSAGALNIPQYSSGGGGITRSISSVSSPTNAGSTALTDYVYLVTGTTTVTLPTAVSNTNQYTVCNEDSSHTATIATTSAQTINGSSTVTEPVVNTCLDFVSNNSNWVIK